MINTSMYIQVFDALSKTTSKAARGLCSCGGSRLYVYIYIYIERERKMHIS